MSDMAALRDAAWVARCVGRAESAPLHPDDVRRLIQHLHVVELAPGERLTELGAAPTSVCIVRHGRLDLVVPGPHHPVIIQALRPGDIDGDIQMLLDIPMPYETRAALPSVCLLLPKQALNRLLIQHPHLAFRWLTSVSGRLAKSHNRLTTLLGRPLTAQVAQVLLDEDDGGVVHLAQVTLAAMLGAARPSVNRVLRILEERGAVQLQYGHILIVNPRELEKAAHDH